MPRYVDFRSGGYYFDYFAAIDTLIIYAYAAMR